MIAVAKRGSAKDHDPRGRLDEVGAGPGTDDKEEGVLNLAV